MNYDNIKIGKGAVVCAEADLKGDVTIGEKTVIHPKVKILAYGGPIVIGESCLIEEQSLILNRGDLTDDEVAKLLKEVDTKPPSGSRGRNAPLRSLTVNQYICGKQQGATMTIGNFNFFEVGAQIEAMSIGTNNVFESKCTVGQEVTVNSGCVVSVFCSLTKPDVLVDQTVVYGPNSQRRIQGDKPMPQTLQLDFLAKILPNFHNLKRSTEVKE